MKYTRRSSTPSVFGRKLHTVQADRNQDVPPLLQLAIGAVHLATVLWDRRKHPQSSRDGSMPACTVTCEVSTAAKNPYRESIDQLLARGRQLVAEVDTIPSEERQDSIADELNTIAQQIHKLLEQEASYLKGTNS
jgi:hypothetical protein